MNEENVKKFLVAIGKITLNLVILKPIFKKWFSFKGLIYTWIATIIYWLGNNLYNTANNGLDLDSSSLLEVIDRLHLISVVGEVAQIGVLLYLLKVYKFYTIGTAHQKLDLAKSLGILDSSEYEQKLLSAKKIQYVEEVEKMYEAGIFNQEQKAHLEQIAEHNYGLKIKQIALQNALDAGVISDDEFKQKSKSITS